MKPTLIIISLIVCAILWSPSLCAQPANDDCSGAFNIVISTSESNVVVTEGDTRGTTQSSIPADVCGYSWHDDDIFFKFTTPDSIHAEGLVIRVYFDNSKIATDLYEIGMALYESCDSLEKTSLCFSSYFTPKKNDRFEISGQCLLANHTYFLRVWSAGSTTGTEGTLRVGIYPGAKVEPFLWWETFGGGLEVNGWTTYGTCNVGPDSIAVFVYLPDCRIDRGAYAAMGYAVSGPSFCDGAVGVDSDYNDTYGYTNSWGGPCSTPGTKYLISPVVYSGDWHVAGLSLTWTQAIRQYTSTFFISFRSKDIGSDWKNWADIQVNTEFPINSNFYGDNVQRIFMPNAAGHDSIQIRFIYNDNYYLWAIDDVRIVETECTNTIIKPKSYAIAPFVRIPKDQVYPFAAMATVFNKGACRQNHGVLNHNIRNTSTNEIVYDEQVENLIVGPDSSVENIFIPSMINLTKIDAQYKATYTLTQDSLDNTPGDNMASFSYSVGGDTFALEDGFTRTLTFQFLFEFYPIFTYGNYFRAVKDAVVDNITWGVNNPDELQGKSVHINLIQWTDTNGDQIAEKEERILVGDVIYTFKGDEGTNALISTALVNKEHPGDPVMMRAGLGYMAMIEYLPGPGDPLFILLASEARDYTARQIAMDSAVAHGLAPYPIYFTALGLSPDGNISDIDYEVKELNVNDTRIFLGNNIIPVIRIIVKHSTNTKDNFDSNNSISVYPNPVSQKIFVKMDFKNSNQNVNLTLINNLGQTVFTRNLSIKSTQHIEPMDVSTIAVGNYLLQINSPDGQRAIPIAAIH